MLPLRRPKEGPSRAQEQSSEEPPECVGVNFALDIMVRCRQKVLVLRETVTSYALTMFIDSEQHEDIKQGILLICAEV